MRLTDISVRALKGSADYKTYFDDTVPAFGVRVGLRRKTFVIVRGKKRERTTIGHYPAMSVGEARTKAKKLLSNEPEPKLPPKNFREAADEYLADNYQDSTSEWPKNVKSVLRHFSSLDHLKLGDITDEHVSGVLDDIKGKSARLHAFRVSRAFFRWCQRPPRRYIRHSPMEGYEAPGKDRKRSRVLTDDELRRVWEASKTGSRRVFQLIMLWGTRSKETTVLEPKWGLQGILTIPGRITKNGRDHAIPLLPLATSVLAQSPPGDFYFPGRRHGRSLTAGALAELRRQVQKDSGTKDWGAHDLRRTFRTNLARLKVPREIAEVLLNHAPQALDEVYDRYHRLPEKRAALAKYEAFMIKLLRSGIT